MVDEVKKTIVVDTENLHLDFNATIERLNRIKNILNINDLKNREFFRVDSELQRVQDQTSLILEDIKRIRRRMQDAK